MKRHETYEEWLKDNPPPDLQALAEAFDGLGNVPPEKWKQFDLAMQAWEVKRKLRHLE